jgi:hypothetical protein
MKTKFKSHKKSYLLVVVCIASFLLVATGWIARQAVGQGKSSEGFKIEEVRFDESVSKRPTPKIPKTWRFVGVSNGTAINSNHLWFQDKEGNIYVVQGFTPRDKGDFVNRFYLTGYIGKITLE